MAAFGFAGQFACVSKGLLSSVCRRVRFQRGFGRLLERSTRSVCSEAKSDVAISSQAEEEPKETTVETPSMPTSTGHKSFKELFKETRFAKAVDPIGSKVKGEVIAIVDGNLYVDFGCKFHAVTPIPEGKERLYKEGSEVIIRLEDLEATCHFQGNSKDTSLLEAQAALVGPAETATHLPELRPYY